MQPGRLVSSGFSIGEHEWGPQGSAELASRVSQPDSGMNAAERSKLGQGYQQRQMEAGLWGRTPLGYRDPEK